MILNDKLESEALYNEFVRWRDDDDEGYDRRQSDEADHTFCIAAVGWKLEIYCSRLTI